MKVRPRIVIDTNVLASALRSRRGASFQLLALVGRDHFEHVITVPLFIEHEDVLHRDGMVSITRKAVDDVLDYLCATAVLQPVHFLWRPRLPDPKDDMVLEAAANGRCTHIVTHNLRDFAAARTLKIHAVTPRAFLDRLKEIET
jgi:putative PIN family toxin of toxin-antitoxin system